MAHMVRSLDLMETPGRIQKVDPPKGPIIYTMGLVDLRIGGSTCWILPGVWDTVLYYTTYYILYTIYYILYTMHYTLYTIHYTILYYTILYYTILDHTIL